MVDNIKVVAQDSGREYWIDSTPNGGWYTCILTGKKFRNKDEVITMLEEQGSYLMNLEELPEITQFEAQLLNAMRSNEYNDVITSDSPTWAFTAVDNSGLKKGVAGAIIANLIKKNLVWWESKGSNGEEDTIGLTELGIKLFDSADGEDCTWGGPKLIDVSKCKPSSEADTLESADTAGILKGSNLTKTVTTKSESVVSVKANVDGKEIMVIRTEKLNIRLGVEQKSKTVIIHCVDCGIPREIKVQDVFQVKRCPNCQKANRNAMRKLRRQEKQADK